MAFEITKVQEDFLAKVLTQVEPFTLLSNDDIYFLVNSSDRLLFKKGDKIYRPGHSDVCLYILLEGSVKITTPNLGGKEVIHELLNSPSIFGLSECYQKNKSKNTAISLSASTVCYSIPFEVLNELMNSNQKFNLKLFHYMSECIKEKENRVEQLMLADARERVVKFIKENAIKRGIRIGYEILLKHNFTQQDIADFAGTSRQTVTNILKDLKDNNKIHIERKTILIRDINDFH